MKKMKQIEMLHCDRCGVEIGEADDSMMNFRHENSDGTIYCDECERGSIQCDCCGDLVFSTFETPIPTITITILDQEICFGCARSIYDKLKCHFDN